MMLYTGHRHDTRRNQTDARHILGARVLRLPAPGAVKSLRQYECPAFDQGACEGCGGHSGALAIYGSLAAAGAPLPFVPSPRDLYALARLVDAPGQPLQDSGVELSNVATAAAQWGIRPIGALNPSGFTDVTTGPDGNVNVPPSLLDLEADAAHLVVDEYRIDLAAPDAITVICSLIDAGVFVQVGGPVGPAYMGYTLGQPAIGPEPNGAGHATTLTGYYAMPDGSIEFDDKTSWGDGFGGDHGHVRVTSAWVRSMWDGLAWACRMVTS
ncbi:MAG: hypothetical protein ACYCPT_02105 [Acidimicrobiales bacterium]